MTTPFGLAAEDYLKNVYAPAFREQLNRTPFFIQLAGRDPSIRLRRHLRVVRNRALAFFICLSALDVATTLVGLTMGAKEANPLMAPVVSNPWALVVTKLVVITMFVIAVRRAPLRRGHAASLFACGLYTTVVVSNILTIGRLTGTL